MISMAIETTTRGSNGNVLFTNVSIAIGPGRKHFRETLLLLLSTTIAYRSAYSTPQVSGYGIECHSVTKELPTYSGKLFGVTDDKCSVWVINSPPDLSV